MRYPFLVAAMLFCISLAYAGAASAAGNFDGGWNAELECPTYGEAEGYTWRFPVQIRGGHLSGKYVNSGDPENYGVLTGTVSADGQASLMMNGRTGPPAYNVHHEGLHTTIHYSASAQFEASSGSGKRVQQRPCDFHFTKN